MKKLKDVANINIKLANLRNRRNFLIQCRRNNIFPSHITNGVHNVECLTGAAVGRTLRQTSEFNHRLRIKILNLEIKITHDSISKFEKTLNITKNQVVNILPYNITTEFFKKQSINYNKVFYKVKASNMRKFTNLVNSNINKIKTPTQWIKNLTLTDIPQEVTNILALGPKFSIKPDINSINIPKFLADIDLVISNVPEEVRNITQNLTTNLITNFVHKSQDSHNNQFKSEYKKCKQFLKNNPELLVIQSDKMNVTTIITKQQYNTLSLEILQDNSYYRVLPRDPSSTIQQKSNTLISELEKSQMLTKDEAKKFRVYNGTINKFYGLPKIHKPVLQLRPIISGVNSPNRGVAQLVTDILTGSYNEENNFFIKDSFQFVEIVNELQLPDNYVLISLDVKALFNNISLELVKKSINKHWQEIQTYCKISKIKLVKLIEFLFDTTVFSHNDVIYKQTLGMPMGSPVSPILSQYVMDDLIEECLTKLNFQIPFLKKYVDDMILCIPQDGAEHLLEVFNSYDPYLKFTIEHEDLQKSVPFLDTKVIRKDDNTIITSWYMKPGASGRFLHYESYHLQQHKINLVLGMKNRVILTSHPSLRIHNLNLLYELLKKSGYPPRLLNSLLFKRTTINGNVDRITQNNNIPFKYFSLPYFEHLSYNLRKIFSKFQNVKLAFRNTLTVKTLFSKLKDKDEILNNSNVIYSIPCLECDKKYIGQTSRKLKDRITSHKSDVRHNKQSCTLARHAIENIHSFDYENVKILDTEPNMYKRQFLEMAHIFKEPNTVNARTDIESLSIIYTYLLSLNSNNRLSDGDLGDTI